MSQSGGTWQLKIIDKYSQNLLNSVLHLHYWPPRRHCFEQGNIDFLHGLDMLFGDCLTAHKGDCVFAAVASFAVPVSTFHFNTLKWADAHL